jgi:Carboxypeptidase regulatory-like domain
MEKPGVVKTKWGRIKLTAIILSSCFLVAVIITGLLQFKKENKMPARSSVKGIIQNQAGQPVEGAIVMITKGSHEFNDMASVSNELGEFFLSNIAVPGQYVLQIQHDNGSVTKTINVQSADSSITIIF